MIKSILIVALLVPLVANATLSVYAQESDATTECAEVVQEIQAILAKLVVDEIRIAGEIDDLEQEFSDYREFAESIQDVIRPGGFSPDVEYANLMFWTASLHMSGLRSQISLLQQRLELIQYDQSVFEMLQREVECQEVVTRPATPLNCTIQGGLIGDQKDRLNELTFIVVEDPDPVQEQWRWIEFRAVTTYDDGARDPELWLTRAREKAQKSVDEEGWIILVDGNHTAFCATIEANCFDPPKAVGPDWELICGVN